MAGPSYIVNADNTATHNSIVQFNSATQLPIKLLGSHNFATWKAQVSMLMNDHKLFGHLDGSSTAPQDNRSVPNPAYEIWFCQDQLIQNAILTSVDPILASTVATTSAHKAWSYLHTTFVNKSHTRIFSLCDQLVHLQKESRPVADYLCEVRSPFDELATAGAPVANLEMVIKILSGLSTEFREISAAIRSCDPFVTCEELYGKLIDQELLLKHEEAKKTPLIKQLLNEPAPFLLATTTGSKEAVSCLEINNGVPYPTGNKGPSGGTNNGNNLQAMHSGANSVIDLVTLLEFVAHSPIIISKHAPVMLTR